MSIAKYGPEHRWFAWRPVETDLHGWRWLRFVWRRKCFLDIPGAPVGGFWTYWPVEP